MSSLDRKIHWIWLVVIVAVLVAGACLAWTAFEASNRMQIQDVEVRGANRLAVQEIVTFAGLVAGQSLLEVHPAQLTARLEHHPWIERARVKRLWLGPGVQIRVWEREPAALVLHERAWLVDANGEPFKAWDPDDGLDLPVITGIDPGTGEAGDGEWARAALAAAVRLLDEIGRLDPAPSFDELHHGPEERWSIVTTDGREIVLGLRETIAAAWARYQHLAPSLPSTPGRAILRVDVSDPRDAYVLLADGPPVRSGRAGARPSRALRGSVPDPRPAKSAVFAGPHPQVGSLPSLAGTEASVRVPPPAVRGGNGRLGREQARETAGGNA